MIIQFTLAIPKPKKYHSYVTNKKHMKSFGTLQKKRYIEENETKKNNARVVE